VIIKLFTVLPFNGPIVLLDEYLYLKNAFALSELSYATPHYPPLYSLFLAPASFFGDNFYVAMKILNVVISSAIIFPVWFLSKKLFDHHSFIVAIIISILNPYQSSGSQLLMSEIFFYPLYIFTIYSFARMLAFQDTKWYILSAILVASCLLTRYISLVMLPCMFFVYLLDAYSKGFTSLFSRKTVVKTVIFLTIFGALIASFYIPNLRYFLRTSTSYTKPIVLSSSTAIQEDTSFAQILTQSIFAPPQIIAWALIYISYFILLISPFLYKIIVKTYLVFQERKTNRFAYYYILISLFSSALFILVSAKHSGTKDYTRWYMLGRYIMFSLPIVLISFIKTTHATTERLRKIATKISFFFLSLALLIIIVRIFGTAEYLLSPHISPDGYVIYNYWYILVPMIVVSVSLSIWAEQLFVPAVLLYSFLCFALAININAEMGMKEAKLINKHLTERKNKTLILDHRFFISDSTQKTKFKTSETLGYLNFWGETKNIQLKNIAENIDPTDTGFVLTNRIFPYEEKIDSIKNKDQILYLYNYPYKHQDRRIDLMELIDTAKNKICISTQYKTDIPSIERNGILHEILINNRLLKRKKENDPFFFFSYSKCILKYEHEIIMQSNNEYRLAFNADSTKGYNFFCQYGFLSLTKGWNESDGMHLSIYYEDALNGKVLLSGKFFTPTLLDNITNMQLPPIRNKKFSIILNTSLSGLTGTGDILCIKTMDLLN